MENFARECDRIGKEYEESSMVILEIGENTYTKYHFFKIYMCHSLFRD
jgi:hypothetical protein